MNYEICENSSAISMSKVKVEKIAAIKWNEEIGKTGAKPEVKVSYQGKTLTEGKDYSIRYEKNHAVGTGYAVLSGNKTEYVGTRRISFKITGTDMKKVKVTGVNPNGYEYSGTKMELLKLDQLTMVYNNKELLPEDYKVSYQKNVKKGSATMILTGNPEKGYTGTKKVKFKITAKPAEKLQVEMKGGKNSGNHWTAPFMKGGSKPEVIVMDGEKELDYGTDYTVSYMKNKNVGDKATLTIKGKGNYGKTTSLEFTVVEKNVDVYKESVIVKAKDKIYSGTKSVWQPGFKVYDEDGKALGKNDIESTEYRIFYLPQTEAESTLKVGDVLDLQEDKNTILPIGSEIKISVTLKGNYKGVVEGAYRILSPGYDISTATIKIAPQQYTGKEVYITDQSQFLKGKVYVKRDGMPVELILGKDIEVVEGSYVKNIQKGTAKVTFKGKEGTLYGGTKTVTFKIGQRSIKEAWNSLFDVIAKTDR